GEAMGTAGAGRGFPDVRGGEDPTEAPPPGEALSAWRHPDASAPFRLDPPTSARPEDLSGGAGDPGGGGAGGGSLAVPYARRRAAGRGAAGTLRAAGDEPGVRGGRESGGDSVRGEPDVGGPARGEPVHDR